MTPTSSRDNVIPMRQSLTVRMAVVVILICTRVPGGERGSTRTRETAPGPSGSGLAWRGRRRDREWNECLGTGVVTALTGAFWLFEIDVERTADTVSGRVFKDRPGAELVPPRRSRSRAV